MLYICFNCLSLILPGSKANRLDSGKPPILSSSNADKIPGGAFLAPLDSGQ